MRFASLACVFGLAISVSSSALAASYTCRTGPVGENKGQLPRIPFRLSGENATAEEIRNGFDAQGFSVSRLEGYTSDGLNTSDGGVTYANGYADIFMSNGCDSAVELRVEEATVAAIIAGDVDRFAGIVISAGTSGGPALSNLTFTCWKLTSAEKRR